MEKVMNKKTKKDRETSNDKKDFPTIIKFDKLREWLKKKPLALYIQYSEQVNALLAQALEEENKKIKEQEEINEKIKKIRDSMEEIGLPVSALYEKLHEELASIAQAPKPKKSKSPSKSANSSENTTGNKQRGRPRKYPEADGKKSNKILNNNLTSVENQPIDKNDNDKEKLD